MASSATSPEGLPLLLSPYEVYLGSQAGWIGVVAKKMQIDDKKAIGASTYNNPIVLTPTQCTTDLNLKKTSIDAPELWHRYFDDPISGAKRRLVQIVFEHLWRKGYYVQVSSHYYSDLVVYEADPLLVHAKYLVICTPWGHKVKLKDLMSAARLSNNVKKTLLIASIRPSDATSSEDLMSTELSTLAIDRSQPSTASDECQRVTFIEFSWQGVS